MTRFRLGALLLSVAGTLSFAACGDDDTVTPDARQQPDAMQMADATPTVDAEPPPPDAEPPPMDTRSGTVAITEVQVIGSPEVGTGPAVSISYVDVEDQAAPAFTNVDGSGAGCTVYTYDITGGESEPAPVGEGTVTITGGASPMPPCTFVGNGYACIAATGALGSGSSVTDDADAGGTIPAGTAILTVAGAAFTNDNIGMYISVEGFTSPTNNGAFPIVNRVTATQVVIANPLAATENTATGTWTAVAGAGPTPAMVPYLATGGGAAVSLNIAKEASDEVEAFPTPTSVTAGGVVAGGGFFTLDDETSGNASQFPQTVGDVTFSCSGTNGACGGGIVIAVSGSTTTANVAGLPPYIMPDATTGTIATFTCAAFGNTLTMPAAAVAELLGTSPTRVEVRAFRFGLAQIANADGTNGTNVLAGRGQVGYTTF